MDSPLRVVAVLRRESSCCGGGGIDRPEAPLKLLRDGRFGALDGKAGEARPGSAGAALAIYEGGRDVSAAVA